MCFERTQYVPVTGVHLHRPPLGPPGLGRPAGSVHDVTFPLGQTENSSVRVSNPESLNELHPESRMNLGEEFIGEEFIGEEFIGEEFIGGEFIGEEFIGEEFIGDEPPSLGPDWGLGHGP